MKTAYCSQCRRVTIMTMTLTHLPVVDDEGKVKKMTIETYHCSSCGLCIVSGVPEKPKTDFIKESRSAYRTIRVKTRNY